MRALKAPITNLTSSREISNTKLANPRSPGLEFEARRFSGACELERLELYVFYHWKHPPFRVIDYTLPCSRSNMPTYEYELCEGDCKICGGKFSLRRPLDAKELTNCPSCKKPVRKVLSLFNSPTRISLSAAKKAGFTVFKKLGKGEYERQ
jgi:putative FmdB family regulatory protein